MSDSLEVVPTQWYESELMALPGPAQTRVERKVNALRQKGWDLAVKDQTIKHLRDGIHELRVLGHGAAFRVLFFVVPGRSPRLVVLTACPAKSAMKKHSRMDAEIERAVLRRALWLEQQKKNKENDDGR